MTYSAFDKPTQILKGSNIVNIFYGPDRKRFKRQDLTSSGATNTVYAMGGAYESIQRPDLTVEEKHYIGGFAVVSTYSTTTIASTRYLLKDHLGSLDTITDEAGAIVQKMSFDAWGKRREIDWTALSGSALLAFDTSITTRGYTGHEMLDPVGLVHMNGRVYDAELGRFLSADPNIQDVENFQNWNRYTYVLNNPLSYTDPSGFFFSKIFKAIGNFFKSVFKAIGSVFKALLKIPLIRAAIQIIACSPVAVGATAALSCAGAAFGMSLAAGGSIGEALLAGALAYAQVGEWGIWEHVGNVLASIGATGNALVTGAVHGVVGGALSIVQGGNFVDGFAGAAIGGAVGVVAQGGPFGYAGDKNPQGMFMRTAAAAVAGGAGAAVAGGKFVNGAVTSAFSHMYNLEMHNGYGENVLGHSGLGPTASGRAADASHLYYEAALGAGAGPAVGATTKAGIGWIELGYTALASKGIYSTTARGTAPAWSTVRGRFWQNMADLFGARLIYGRDNLIRMRKRRAPQRYNKAKLGYESKELSHEPIPRRQGGTKFRLRWPQDHAKVDPHRHVNY